MGEVVYDLVVSDAQELSSSRAVNGAPARVPLFHNREVVQADGSSELTSVLRLIGGMTTVWIRLGWRCRSRGVSSRFSRCSRRRSN